MSKNDQKARSQKMAADLIARGYWHGRRPNKTNAPAIPNFTDVGSAAYRRLQKKRGNQR